MQTVSFGKFISSNMVSKSSEFKEEEKNTPKPKLGDIV